MTKIGVSSYVDCSVLAEKVGITRAKGILFTSTIFGVENSQRLGLIDRIEEGDSLSEAVAFAAQLSRNAPLSLAGNKASLNAIASGTVDAQIGELQQLIDAAFNSHDYIEGRRAFAERRAPAFRGI